MTYHYQSRLGKTDCTDIWVIKLKNQVSPSIGFRVPHWIKFFNFISLAELEPGKQDCFFSAVIETGDGHFSDIPPRVQVESGI